MSQGQENILVKEPSFIGRNFFIITSKVSVILYFVYLNVKCKLFTIFLCYTVSDDLDLIF